MTIQTTHPPTLLLPIVTSCLGAILVGFSPIFVRVADLGPMNTGFYRLLVASPFLWLWMYWEKKFVPRYKNQDIQRSDYFIMFLAGAFFGLDLALWNWSLGYTTIVNATVFNNTAAFFVPLLLWLVFAEKQSKRFIWAAIFGFLGCALLGGESFTISLKNLLGDIVSLGSGVLVALYVITIKKIRDRLPTGLLMFWTSIAGALVMGILGLLFGESFWPLTFNDLVCIVGLAILVHTAGQGLLAYAMGEISASYGALIMLLSPVTAAILGLFIYGETLSFIKVIGIAIVMGSIVAVRQKKSVISYKRFLKRKS